MKHFLPSLLTTALEVVCLLVFAAPAPKPEPEILRFPTPTDEAKLIGPGTELAYDAGYFPGFDSGEGRELPWVPLPVTLEVIGETDKILNEIGRHPPELVCVKKGAKEPYEQFFTFSKTNLRGAKIVKLVKGDLPDVNPIVPYDPNRR